jgi:hypothetical protein
MHCVNLAHELLQLEWEYMNPVPKAIRLVVVVDVTLVELLRSLALDEVVGDLKFGARFQMGSQNFI